MKNSYSSFLKEQITDYLRHRVSLGYNEKTYTASLKSLDSFLSEKYPNDYMLSREMFGEWLSENSQWSSNTMNRMINQIAAFLRFTYQEDSSAFIPDSSMAPRTTHYQPCIVNDETMNFLFRCIDEYRSPDYAPSYFHIVYPVLFRMTFLCGLRPAEPRSLLRTDVDLLTGLIKIRNTKRHKSRQIYMSEDLLELCRRYNDAISVLIPEREYFFMGKNKKKITNNDLTYAFHRVRNRIDSKYGLKKFRIYDFRHNFATRSIMQGIKKNTDFFEYLPLLSAYMGHAHIDETLYYVSLLPSLLKDNEAIEWNMLDDILPEVNDENKG